MIGDIVGVSAAKLVPWALVPVTLVLVGRHHWMGLSRRGGEWQIPCDSEDSVRELVSQSAPGTSVTFTYAGEGGQWIGRKSVGSRRERKSPVTNLHCRFGCALGT